MKLTNKAIVITGAAQGLGEVLAYKVANEGAKVALVDIATDKLEKVKAKIKKEGGIAETFICNICDLSSVKLTINKILEAFKDIDILINNAAIWTDDALEKKHPERRKLAFEINVIGNMQIIYEVLPFLKKKNAGYIFNVLSTSGVADIPAGDNRLWKTYGATKWAMAGFTKTLRDELVDTKIKITGFFPGGFESNFYENAKRPNPHQQPWMMRTEDVADIIVFALTRPEDVLMERIVVTKIEQ